MLSAYLTRTIMRFLQDERSCPFSLHNIFLPMEMQHFILVTYSGKKHDLGPWFRFNLDSREGNCVNVLVI